MQDIVENKLGTTTEFEFDRCHRTGKFKRNQSKPRRIVCRLLRFKDIKKFCEIQKSWRIRVFSSTKTFVNRQWNFEER